MEESASELLAELQAQASRGEAEAKAWRSLASRLGESLSHHARRLHKQLHDFNTVFEVVSQLSARAMDVKRMMTYLLRTVAGQFAVSRILILRKNGEVVAPVEWQGLRDPEVEVPLESPLAAVALRERRPLFVGELPPEVRRSREVRKLEGAGVDLLVPLAGAAGDEQAELEGFLCLGPKVAGLEFKEDELTFLAMLGRVCAICFHNEALYHRSITDGLTGIYSRGHFDTVLEREINRIVRYQRGSIALLMLDLDELKRVNDGFGHQVGDVVLRRAAEAIKEQVRNVDTVARYGGDEFCVVLLEINWEWAAMVAERIRAALENMEVIAPGDRKVRVTASLGGALFPNDAASRQELVEVADRALYHAKEGGRNRVRMALPGAGVPEGAE